MGSQADASYGTQRETAHGRPWIRRLATLVLLGIGVHLLLPQLTELQHALQVVRNMTWWVVGLAAVAQVCSYAGTGYLMSSLVSDDGQRLPVGRAIVITLASGSLGMVAGGMVGVAAATYRWLRASHIDGADASITGGLIIQINNAAMILAALVGLIHLLILHSLSLAQIVGFALVLLVLIIVVLGVVIGRRHPTWVIGRIEPLSRGWHRLTHRPHRPERVEADVRQILGVWDRLRARGLRGPLLGAAAELGFDMLTLYLLFAAAGSVVTPGVLLTGYGLPLLLGKVSFLPGGVGLVEATMAALYGSLGVPSQVLVVVILAYRLFSFWVPALLGFALVPYLNRRRGISAASR